MNCLIKNKELSMGQSCLRRKSKPAINAHYVLFTNLNTLMYEDHSCSR
jgi:hypothetical protein